MNTKWDFNLCKGYIKRIYKSPKRKNMCCIVIPTYNQYNITKKTIELLKKQTISPEIIIIDNASNDRTFEKIIREFPDVTVIELKKNYGSSGAQYIGAVYALSQGYDYIILSDNDAQPIDITLVEDILKKATKEKAVVIPTNLFGGNITGFSKEKTKITTSPLHYLCIPRDILENCGLPIFNLFLKADDYELTTRISKKRYRITRIDSRYYHPIKIIPSPLANYYLLRNYIVITKLHNDIYKAKNVFNTLLSWGIINITLSTIYMNPKIFTNSFLLAIRDAFTQRLGKAPYKFPIIKSSHVVDIDHIKKHGPEATLFIYYKNSEVITRIKKAKILDKHRFIEIRDTPSIRKQIKYISEIIKHRSRILILLEPLTPHAGYLLLLFGSIWTINLSTEDNKIHIIYNERIIKRITKILIGAILTLLLVVPLTLGAMMYYAFIYKTPAIQRRQFDPCNTGETIP
ncbi:glycosyltransferase [Thermococcus radiotolerans]|uniref:Glycosyltransferase 2-like domain-containing protein n=1 Tax=Thermococcus radiotolerans TaxID=187880 RepID=A0A2Z2MZI7_9EURY|nr:glycosyltransferase [Thermococcus radiotolerans]ASJ15228.1 hypothetical protein A3L10_08840 [Thermococcus radiotolerans]